MRRYYFPIFYNGETQADETGELFDSAELAVQYGARVAWDIASDPEYQPGAGTVVIVVDGSGAEIVRHRVSSVGAAEAELPTRIVAAVKDARRAGVRVRTTPAGEREGPH